MLIMFSQFHPQKKGIKNSFTIPLQPFAAKDFIKYGILLYRSFNTAHNKQALLHVTNHKLLRLLYRCFYFWHVN